MKFPQAGVPEEAIPERLKLVRGYIRLTRSMHEMAFPTSKKGWGSDFEMLVVLMCVFVGDASGRPMSATRIGIYAGLSRTTVYRRLETLLEIGKIVRVGRLYYYAPNAISVDNFNKFPKIFDGFNID